MCPFCKGQVSHDKGYYGGVWLCNCKPHLRLLPNVDGSTTCEWVDEENGEHTIKYCIFDRLGNKVHGDYIIAKYTVIVEETIDA